MKTVQELFDLTGKTAVVTGGLGHLGRASSEALLELGARVIVTTPGDEEDMQGVEIKKLDFTERGAIANFFTQLEEDVDILVNNAVAPGVDGILLSVDQCCQEAFPLMKKSHKGVIINIGSMYGVVAPDFRVYEGSENLKSKAEYGAAKAGVIQLTRYLAADWAQHGIRVNTISPGPFSHHGRPEEFLRRLREKTMLKRTGVPQDLKGLVALLASDASDYITGQNFIIDGGWTAW